MSKHRNSRLTPSSLFLALFLVAAPLCSATVLAEAPLVCESVGLSEKKAQAVCTVPATTASQAVRFKAHFLGSHDDSEVSLQSVELNGERIACRTGSKTESRFEDGEVTLDCGFTTATDSFSHRLKVSIALNHLQLDRTELVLE